MAKPLLKPLSLHRLSLLHPIAESVHLVDSCLLDPGKLCLLQLLQVLNGAVLGVLVYGVIRKPRAGIRMTREPLVWRYGVPSCDYVPWEVWKVPVIHHVVNSILMIALLFVCFVPLPSLGVLLLSLGICFGLCFGCCLRFCICLCLRFRLCSCLSFCSLLCSLSSLSTGLSLKLFL